MQKPNHFRVTLAQFPEAVNELSNDSLLRYMRGEFPKAVQWLMRYPALLRALAEDAEAMQHLQQDEGVPA